MDINVENLPVTLRVTETAEQMRVSKRTVYNLIASGELKSIKVGRRRLIPRAAIAEYVASRERVS